MGKQSNGSRARRVFPTRGEAETFAEQKRVERANEGSLTFAVPWEIRREAAKCTQKLAPYQSSLTEATEYYVQHVLKYRTAPDAAHAVTMMLAQLETGGRRESAIKALRCFLGGTFVRQFGDRQFTTITLDELNALCLVPALQPRTRLNRIRMISQLYRYAQDRGWVAANLAEQIVRPILDPKMPGFLSVPAAQRLLQLAPYFNLLPYVALGLFAGVRSAELLRLDWSAINLLDHEITIGPEIAKTRSRRVIPFDDILGAWLAPHVRSHGPVVDCQIFDAKFGALRRAAGCVPWPSNALRHSFATYHVAQFRDPVRTAYLLGHRGGTDMLDRHYRGLVSSARSKEFWNLTPSFVGTQPMEQAA